MLAAHRGTIILVEGVPQNYDPTPVARAIRDAVPVAESSDQTPNAGPAVWWAPAPALVSVRRGGG